MEEIEKQELLEEWKREKRCIRFPIISNIVDHFGYVKFLEEEVIKLDQKEIDYRLLFKKIKEVASFNNYDKDTNFAEYKAKKIAELINDFENDN